MLHAMRLMFSVFVAATLLSTIEQSTIAHAHEPYSDSWVTRLFPFWSCHNDGLIQDTKWSNIKQTLDGQEIPEGIISLTFTADGSLEFVAGPELYKGTYKLSSGHNVILNLDKPLSGSKTHHERIEIHGNSMKMIDSDGKSLTFKEI
jgi:hypothetical protein